MSDESVNQLYQEIMHELDLLQQFIADRDRKSLVNMAVEVRQKKGHNFIVDQVKQPLVANQD